MHWTARSAALNLRALPLQSFNFGFQFIGRLLEYFQEVEVTHKSSVSMGKRSRTMPKAAWEHMVLGLCSVTSFYLLGSCTSIVVLDGI